ncbi:hypothetical protein AAFN75_01560 [Algibacter sp. AS12]|uniref:hypothetical protein n=1 Tax=Algibacter sp. AS12 TaxID=3135773 RepID=UPI00398AC9F9
MKSLKTKMLILVLLPLAALILNAQDQAYWIHEDQVNLSKTDEYEQVTKDFIQACKKHNLQNADWKTAYMEDGVYLSITPINKMADFDSNPLAPLAEKMGEDKFKALFKRFDQCYDTHGDYIMFYNEALSYMPIGRIAGENYRKWHYFHVTPSKSKAFAEKLIAIKAIYVNKNAKESYRIYHSGFGVMGEYYVASISAKDEESYLKTSDNAETLFGDKDKLMFMQLLELTHKYEKKSGAIRHDLSYSTKL